MISSNSEMAGELSELFGESVDLEPCECREIGGKAVRIAQFSYLPRRVNPQHQARRQVNQTAIVLHDPDRARLDSIVTVLRGQASVADAEPAFSIAPSMESALEGADFVFLAIRVGGLEAGEEHALSGGARKHAVQPGETFRVFLGPDDHPFCLGVQWHPEWKAASNPVSVTLFRKFASAAGRK